MLLPASLTDSNCEVKIYWDHLTSHLIINTSLQYFQLSEARSLCNISRVQTVLSLNSERFCSLQHQVGGAAGDTQLVALNRRLNQVRWKGENPLHSFSSDLLRGVGLMRRDFSFKIKFIFHQGLANNDISNRSSQPTEGLREPTVSYEVCFIKFCKKKQLEITH